MQNVIASLEAASAAARDEAARSIAALRALIAEQAAELAAGHERKRETEAARARSVAATRCEMV